MQENETVEEVEKPKPKRKLSTQRVRPKNCSKKANEVELFTHRKLNIKFNVDYVIIILLLKQENESIEEIEVTEKATKPEELIDKQTDTKPTRKPSATDEVYHSLTVLFNLTVNIFFINGLKHN